MRSLTASVALVLALFVPTGAAEAAKVELDVNPAMPVVDDNITVKFESPISLKSPDTLAVTLVGKGNCSSSVASKTIKPPVAKGKGLRVKLSPRDQVVDSASEWCQGKASIALTQASNGEFEKKLAQTTIRFVRKP